jgi:hypothetical protein
VVLSASFSGKRNLKMFSQIRPRTKDLRAADRVVQSGGPNAHGDHGWRPTDILSASLPYGSNHNQDGSGVSPRPLENGGIRQPDLINGEINVLAVGLQPRRNGSGHFIVLRLTGCEYQEAVCYSEKFPFTIAAGQRVRAFVEGEENTVVRHGFETPGCACSGGQG